WFVGNVNLTAMATGVTTLSVGGSLGWTILATVLGSLFGTFFMAFHSAQGPQLGLPQLVQSRPQFGYVGAAMTVWVFALINYIAYNTSDAIMSGDGFHVLFGLNTNLGYFIAACFAAVLALFGYRWIHLTNRIVAGPLLVILLLLTIGALRSTTLPSQAFAFGPFQAAPFMTAFTIVAGFQLGWAPYVSDYSRYLPASVGVRSTFWWTYLPSGLSAIWVFALGTLAARAAPGATPVAAFKQAGDHLFPGFGWLAVLGLLAGQLAVMAVNQYGGMMSLISIRDSIRPVRPTLRIRAIGIAIMFVLVWAIAQFVGVERFNVFYGNVLIFLAYLFTPWTAINLVDYFFVRRGLYAIKEIFAPRGIYGRWGWRGNAAYGLSLTAMVPFMVTEPFTGFAAKALGGVDYSLFVGLPLAAVLYWAMCRSLDLAAERRIVAAEGLLRPV
ncbi:MAG: cytosine permease, partial [Pseudomonadota bacterium]|nr:cytosine permease [Pseudomonadota bacterium]